MNIQPITDRSTLEESLAHINPLPPVPTDRDTIISLIDDDQVLIMALEKSRVRRQNVLVENQSKATAEEAYLKLVKGDLARAQKFQAHIKGTTMEALTFAQFAAEEAGRSEMKQKGVPAQITHPSATGRVHVSMVTASYLDSVLSFSNEAESLLKKTFSTVLHHQETLQTARTLAQMAQKDLDMIDQQILQLRNAAIRKKFMLQAIWRVPDDIWTSVFAYATGTTIGETGRDNGWLRNEANWPGALVISLVCRRWRAVATACSKLWSNIVIVRGEFEKTAISRINHYLTLARNVGKTLLIDTSKLTGSYLSDLCSLGLSLEWPDYNLDRIVCILGNRGSSDATTRLLRLLPAATSLWVLGASDKQSRAVIPGGIGTHYPLEIPKRLIGGLKHLVTQSAKIAWGSELLGAQLLSYTVDHPPVNYVSPIDVFAPDSIPTMMELHIRTAQEMGHNPVLAERVTLPRVTNLHTSISYLFGHISRRFNLPALVNLTIVDAGDAVIKDYEAIKQWISSTHIKSLVCESMGNIGPLYSLITDIDALTSLELQGETVVPVLSSLASRCSDEAAEILPSLTHLTIASYSGGGAPILSFLEAWKGQGKSSPHLRTLNVTVFADECPGLSLEVRKAIISLAERRGRCESSSLPSLIRLTHRTAGKKVYHNVTTARTKLHHRSRWAKIE